jgi:hypothetical protein
MPPHATHAVPAPLHTEYGPGQPMPVQHAWPVLPHVPPPQLPFTHVPVPPPQSLPLPTHMSFTQHAPLPHAWPLQHGWPGPPHASQLPPPPPATQARLPAVQVPAPKPPVGQHASPSPPQVNAADVHAPIMQVVTMPHMVPEPTHMLFTQQPPPLHVPPPQHAWPASPHAVAAPARQT